jgi:hypothetical protein
MPRLKQLGLVDIRVKATGLQGWDMFQVWHGGTEQL